MVELKPIKTLTFVPRGVMEEDTTVDQKNKVEIKLMLQSNATNNELEAVT